MSSGITGLGTVDFFGGTGTWGVVASVDEVKKEVSTWTNHNQYQCHRDFTNCYMTYINQKLPFACILNNRGPSFVATF